MNPKDMTNMQLVEAIKDQRFSLVDETKELLRRLNERDQYKIQWENCNSDFHFAVEQADALRKENEELRNSLLGSIKQMRSITTSTTLWNAVEFAYKERAYCVDGVPYTAWSDMHRNINDEIELAEKLLVSVTSEKAKESEASHE